MSPPTPVRYIISAERALYGAMYFNNSFNSYFVKLFSSRLAKNHAELNRMKSKIAFLSIHLEIFLAPNTANNPRIHVWLIFCWSVIHALKCFFSCFLGTDRHTPSMLLVSVCVNYGNTSGYNERTTRYDSCLWSCFLTHRYCRSDSRVQPHGFDILINPCDYYS